ncbi:hypothetical protein Ancab_028607 [Ancistrocladus abbreviatus]
MNITTTHPTTVPTCTYDPRSDTHDYLTQVSKRRPHHPPNPPPLTVCASRYFLLEIKVITSSPPQKTILIAASSVSSIQVQNNSLETFLKHSRFLKLSFDLGTQAAFGMVIQVNRTYCSSPIGYS